MYAIAAYINVIQLKGVIARVAGVTYPGRKASANFCLRRFRIVPTAKVSSRLTENREPARSLGCPHPSRRNQVPTGDNATAALILSIMVTDIDKNLKSGLKN